MAGDIIVTSSHDWVDYLTLVGTLAGVVIVAIYTCLTYRQLKATETALEETQKSNANTEESNRIAKDSLELGTRAWLVVKLKRRDKADIDIATLSRITEAVELTNLGATPAMIAEVRGQFYLRDNPPEIPDEIEPDQPPVTGIIIGPGGSHELIVHSWDVAVSEATRNRINRGEVVYFFYCLIKYRDFFDVPRETETCLQLSPNTRWQDRLDDWVFAPKHNRIT